MKSRAAMADSAPKARYRIWTLLIGAVIATTGLVSSARAADLTDIRIGEYMEYTRIVFEFDGPIDQEARIVQNNGRMTVLFREAEPHLVRKIPFHHSKRISNHQIWADKNNLSIVLLFERAISRYESFRMRDPFRFTLDIYPQTEPASNNKIETLITKNSSGKAAPLPKEPASSPIASSSREHENTGPPLASGEKDMGAASALPPRSNGSQSANHDIVLPQTQTQTPLPHQNPATVISSDQSTAESKSPTSSLQYYLIIALVIITLIILALLAMMIMVRHKWADDNKPRRIKNLLELQDEHIASLNERIEEQLKRYDQA